MLRFWYVIIISLPYIIYYLAKGKLYREKYGTLFRGRPLSRGTSCDSCHETKWQDSDECDWRGESAGGGRICVICQSSG